MATDVVVVPAGRSVAARVVSSVGRSRELTLFGVMIVLSLIVTARAPQFLSPSNLDEVTTMAAIMAVAAVGESLTIITKNIDLSVESTIGLSAFVVADILSQHTLSVPEAWAAGIGLGLVLGMANGAVITLFRIPSIVVTLGTLSIFRGLAFFVAGGREMSLAQLPPGYSNPASQTFFGIPLFVLVAITVVAVVALLLRLTPFGRHLYAVGSNAEAASIIGIRSRVTIFLAFSLCGLLAGVAGVLWGIAFGTIYATSASGIVLQIVAAAVVGGVVVSGGSGTVIGAALGALFLGVINNALLLLLMPQELLQVIYGVVILLAITTGALMQRRERRIAAGIAV
jgi:rhamnose transport system permease protein